MNSVFLFYGVVIENDHMDHMTNFLDLTLWSYVLYYGTSLTRTSSHCRNRGPTAITSPPEPKKAILGPEVELESLCTPHELPLKVFDRQAS